MKFTQPAVLLGACAIVFLISESAQAQQRVAPPPPPATPPASPAPTAAPTTPAAPGVPPPTEPSGAPAATEAPSATPALAPAPAPAAPPPIQLSPAPTEPESARTARAKTNSRAAVKSSPFMDATLNGTWLEDRFGDPFVFGVQGGAYLGEVVRLAIRLEMPTENARDEYSIYDYDAAPQVGNGTYTNVRRSEPPTLLYGAALGVVATSSENFVFAPGLVFVRSDVSDYGSMLGVSMPFEWVTARGMRFGLELDLGRAFGGTVHNQTCSFPVNMPSVCTESDGDRNAGRAFALRFQMGFGFNRPQ